MRILLIENENLLRQAESLLLSNVLPEAQIDAEDYSFSLQCDAFCADVLIFGMHHAETESLNVLRQVVENAGDIPVVVLGARPNTYGAIVKAGARGVISGHSAPAAVSHILSLVAAGESVFPAIPQEPAPIARPHDVKGMESDSGEEQNLNLTERQLAVVRLVARGLSNKAIARELDIFEGTVKAHLRSVTTKMGVSNRTELALLAASHGLSPDMRMAG